MKKIIYAILLILSASVSGQVMPNGFEEAIRNEYDGFSEETIQNELKLSFEEYLAIRSEEHLRKQQYYQSLTSSRSVNNLCDNGTFESGAINPSDWEFEWGGSIGTRGGWVSGVWSVINYSNVSSSNLMNSGFFDPADHPDSVHHKTVTTGIDPKVAVLDRVWNFPAGNTTSVRLGNTGVSKGYESMNKVVNINPTNSILTFSYAMVVQNPGHGLTSDPFFRLNLIDASNPTIDYNNLVNLGGTGINYVTSAHPLLKTYNGIQYKDWTCVTVDLSPLIGKTIIVEFLNRDCWAGGHWGYSYIDNICVNCDGANGDEGSINLNQGQSDDCEIPGQICIDYTLPNGASPSLTLDLEIIQNGVVVNTINSPNLTSGNTYCFDLNTINTSGLNTTLLGFDYKIIGNPRLGTFNLTPKIIGSSANGITNGTNDDYDIYCSSKLNCCENPIEIERTNEGSIVNAPNGIYNSDPFSLVQDEFTIQSNSLIPITEFRAVVTDLDFEYNYDACATCVDNPALWGSIGGSLYVGNTLTNTDTGTNILADRINRREVIWEEPRGAMLAIGDKFTLDYAFPAFSEIPCCVTTANVCVEISYKDANCVVCTEVICRSIELSEVPKPVSALKINVSNDGCCSRTLTADADTNADFQWSTNENTKSITVSKNGTYTVTATAGGVTKTETIVINDIVSGSFPLLSFNSLFHPDFVPPYKNKFYIMDVSPGKVTEGVPNSYNATEYKLEIYHEWNTSSGQGQPLKTITGVSNSCDGFNNWDIQWDGTNQSGVSLKDDRGDSYVWHLTLKNCDNESSKLTYKTSWVPVCEEPRYLFPKRKWIRIGCKKWGGYWKTETFSFGDVQMHR